MAILLVGGAGYIGSHLNKYLVQQGLSTLVLDNLEKGHRESVQWGEFVLGDIRNTKQLELIFGRYPIESVVHLAAYLSVPESVQKPQQYYINNVVGTLNLLRTMKKYQVKQLIFSSTCATYGQPAEVPVHEEVPFNPINPYGRSKVMIEQILEDYAEAYDFRYVSLRYFNPVGADPEADIGFTQDPAVQLVPILLEAAYGKRDKALVFGSDYNTKDGTPVRDYIHIQDLVRAHHLALGYLKEGGQSEVFNLGSENGYTVQEVIEVVKKVTGKDFPVEIVERRAGDAEKLYADSHKAQKKLKWQTKHNLERMVKDADRWYQKYFLGK